MLKKGIVLKYMKESLKEIREGSHNTLIIRTIEKMVDAKLIDKPSTDNPIEHYNYIGHNNKKLEALIVECYTYLILHEIIIPKPVTPNYGSYGAWNSYKITSYGKKWISSEEKVIPEDIDGYINFLKGNVSTIDNVIIQYVNEALKTFNGRYLFASAVMLGAAAEKIIYLLSEAIENSTTDQDLKRKMQSSMKYRKFSNLFNLVSETLDKLIDENKISYNIHEGSNHYLFSLFNAIRIQRNEAVHPIAGEVKSDELRLLLLSFPHNCKKSYDFLLWLRNNTI